MWGPGYIIQDRWQLLDQIGHGSYSTVWRALDLKDEGKLVAVKNLRLSRDLDSSKRALREILLLKHFKNQPQIVGLIDVIVIPGTKSPVEEICIVSELMEMDLHTLIQQQTQPLNLDYIKIFMFQILSGVATLHQAHVLHRDLKPKNILVNASTDLQTKICDFGMGRSKSTSAFKLKMTQISEVATASYRAPDGILRIATPYSENQSPATTPRGTLKTDYSSAVDVWACGCILAEMLLGTPLFPVKENTVLLTMIVQTLGAPPSSLLERIHDSPYLPLLQTLIEEHENSVPRIDNMLSSTAAANPEAINLCLQMLQFDPANRISILSALQHDFFSDIVPYSPPTSLEPFEDPTNIPDLDLEQCNRLTLDTVLLQSNNSLPQSLVNQPSILRGISMLQ